MYFEFHCEWGTMADGSHSSYVRFEILMDYKDYHLLECDAT